MSLRLCLVLAVALSLACAGLELEDHSMSRQQAEATGFFVLPPSTSNYGGYQEHALDSGYKLRFECSNDDLDVFAQGLDGSFEPYRAGKSPFRSVSAPSTIPAWSPQNPPTIGAWEREYTPEWHGFYQADALPDGRVVVHFAAWTD